MDFSKLFLGYNETNDFMKLAIREKIITKYADCFDDEPIMSEENHFRIYNKTELLRLMLLFESIDTNHLVLYDVDKLIDTGLVLEDSFMNRHGQFPEENDPVRFVPEKLKLIDTENLSFESLITEFIMNLDGDCGTNFFENIFHLEIKKISIALECGDINKIEQFFLKPEIVNLLAESIMETSLFRRKKYIGKPLSECIKIAKKIAVIKIQKHILDPISQTAIQNKCNMISDDDKITECYNILNEIFFVKGKKCKKCEYQRTVDCLDAFSCEYALDRQATLLDIFTSLNCKVPVYSKYFNKKNIIFEINTKIVDNVYYLFKLPELKQLNSLPSPQSFEEALRLRSRPEIISFRNVFKAWCEELQNFGDIKTIEMITNDFNRASYFLKRQYKENDKQKTARYAILKNIISILMLVPGYFIPFFSLLFDIPKVWTIRNKAIERVEIEWFLLTK